MPDRHVNRKKWKIVNRSISDYPGGKVEELYREGPLEAMHGDLIVGRVTGGVNDDLGTFPKAMEWLLLREL
jgi:hypothetical protein